MEENTKFSIGQYLREKREKRNLTIKHVSQMTKINPTQIELLEKDLLSKLPNRAYVNGYVKAYAKALGASQEEALGILDKTYRSQNPIIPTAPLKMEVPVETPVRETTSESESPKKSQKEKLAILGIAGVVIAATSLTMLFKKNPSKEAEELKVPVEMTPTVSPTASPTLQIPVKTPSVLATLLPSIAPSNLTSHAPKATPSPQPTSTPTPAPTKTPPPKEEVKKEEPLAEEKKIPAFKIFPDLGISSPLNSIELVTTPQPNHQDKPGGISIKTDEKGTDKKEEKKQEKKDDKKKSNFYKIRQPLYQLAPHDDSVSKIPENIKSQATNGKQNAYVRAEGGRTWITYKIDKEPVKQIFLKENTGVLLSGAEIRLFLGNANVAKVFINNQSVDMQLKRGIKNLVFPESSNSKYAVPLFIFGEEGSISTSDDYMKKKGLAPQ